MCAFLLMMTSLSTSYEGRDKARSYSASADATLTLSVGASVVDVLRWANGKGAVLGSDGFYSGQDLLVLCRQSIVQMGIYTQALGEGLDTWLPSSLSMDETRRGQSDGNG